MLANVCSRCKKVIDGKPVLEKEYPDATLLIREDVVCMYDDLCPSCEEKLREVVEMFVIGDAPKKPDGPAPAPEQAPEAARPSETPPTGKSDEPSQEQKPSNGQRRPIDKDSLPNQVTKQFPIKMPKHTS